MSTSSVQKCHKAFVRLDALKDEGIEALRSNALTIAQEYFSHLQKNPSLQAMEICDKGYKDFERQARQEFESSHEVDIMRMYLASAADTSFHSRSFRNEIQTLIVGH